MNAPRDQLAVAVNNTIGADLLNFDDSLLDFGDFNMGTSSTSSNPQFGGPGCNQQQPPDSSNNQHSIDQMLNTPRREETMDSSSDNHPSTSQVSTNQGSGDQSTTNQGAAVSHPGNAQGPIDHGTASQAATSQPSTNLAAASQPACQGANQVRSVPVSQGMRLQSSQPDNDVTVILDVRNLAANQGHQLASNAPGTGQQLQQLQQFQKANPFSIVQQPHPFASMKRPRMSQLPFENRMAITSAGTTDLAVRRPPGAAMPGLHRFPTAAPNTVMLVPVAAPSNPVVPFSIGVDTLLRDFGQSLGDYVKSLEKEVQRLVEENKVLKSKNEVWEAHYAQYEQVNSALKNIYNKK